MPTVRSNTFAPLVTADVLNVPSASIAAAICVTVAPTATATLKTFVVELYVAAVVPFKPPVVWLL